jgi:hypothetical protein
MNQYHADPADPPIRAARPADGGIAGLGTRTDAAAADTVEGMPVTPRAGRTAANVASRFGAVLLLPAGLGVAASVAAPSGSRLRSAAAGAFLGGVLVEPLLRRLARGRPHGPGQIAIPPRRRWRRWRRWVSTATICRPIWHIGTGI